MTLPASSQPATGDSRLVRAAVWVAIGALIASAFVCVLWVLLGTGNDVVGRAFLTILLLAAFAGVAILDARLAPGRPAWFALASMVAWVVSLLLGAFLIWMPESGDAFYTTGFSRFASFLLIVLVLQLALLHVRLYMKAHDRNPATFIRVTTYITVGLVVVLAAMLVFALAFGEFVDLPNLYWRWVVAIAILAAVGTALVPLVNALFAPRRPRERAVHRYGEYVAQEPAPWPTYIDGITPLPFLPDGSPDWSAYYTGYPSAASQVFTPLPPAPVPVAEPEPDPAPAENVWPDPWPEPALTTDDETTQRSTRAQPPAPRGYEGYPPPPPLPR
jgi:hypothetical protein